VSAIAGVFFLDSRPVDRPVLERMIQSLAHRGPDRGDVWIEGSVGLGHRMLWTTPESLHEKLPLVNKTRDLALTADARIDNRDELITALGFTDYAREEISDGELILAAYEQWGERCPERLLGDFAFAVWDQRKQALFCARDHMGTKPLYYHRSGWAFVFASEIKGLLCVPEVPRRLNEVRVADYLVPILEDKEITFYQEILRLPPAHRMTVDRNGVRIEPYWSLDPYRKVRYSSDGEYAEAFREVFTEAVRCRLRSAFPVGSLLSGGLDSSAIVCTARQLLSPGYRLRTFSTIFDDVPQCDERPFIDAVLAGGGLEPHYMHGDRLSPMADLDRVFHHQDEAFFSPNLFMYWAAQSTAHQQDVRVLLDGQDGDTTVSHGLAYLPELARRGHWMTLAAEVNGLNGFLVGASPRTILRRLVIGPLVPEPIRQVWRRLHGRTGPSWADDTPVRPDFAQRIGLADRIQALGGKDRSRPARTSREEHWRNLTTGVIPFALEVMDRVTVAFSIEPRYPFFDKRLVELCLALPPEQKLNQGWTRVVMRRAMTNILPAKVQWRENKSNLSPNFSRGLLAFERGLLEEVILDDPQAIEEYVDVPALRETYHRYASRGMDSDAMTVWRAITLALWLRRTGLAR
jgi:asparagine synthase (glutamine-hydrolysing)